MRKIATLVLIVVMLGGLGACAGAPPTPQTVPQKLYYGYGSIEGLATSVESLYRAGVISKDEVIDMAHVINQAHDLLDLSEMLYRSGADGQDNLIKATNLLGVVRDFLLERSQRQ